MIPVARRAERQLARALRLEVGAEARRRCDLVERREAARVAHEQIEVSAVLEARRGVTERAELGADQVAGIGGEIFERAVGLPLPRAGAERVNLAVELELEVR